MAQLATVLSNEHLAGASGRPRWNTTVFDGSTGIEQRNARWASPRHAWSVTFTGLLTDLQPIIDLHLEAQGQAYSFLWTPPGYTQGSYRFGADEIEVSYIARNGGVGDYVATITFPLIEVLDE